MSKPVLLLIHGFPFDRSMWRHQLAALSRWQCIAPDLRGAGTADVPASAEAYSMGSYAADLVQQLNARRITSAVVCGLSLGGYIAFELLRQYPKRVRAMILCNTKPSADTPEAKRARDELAAKARAQGAKAVARELVPKLLSRATHDRQPEVVREVTELIERQPVAGIVGALHALRERPDSTPLLEQIRIPVLVVAGEDDQITPAAGMQDMARAIPRAQFALIPDAGHLTPLEQPVTVSSALADFLTKLG